MCLAMDEIEADARLKGKIEGEIEGKKEIISVMLRKGKTVDEIVNLCDCPKKFVLEVEESLLVGAR